MVDKTTIIVSHRISTIQHADQIIMIDNGEIIEQGTHKELIDLNKNYNNLYKKQLFEQ